MEKLPKLAEYALFIKNNHLEAYTKEGLRLSKELDMPLLKFYTHLSDEELFQLSIKGNIQALDIFINENLREHTLEQMKLWETDQLPDAQFKKRDIKIADLILSYQIGKKNLLHFLSDFTQDLPTVLAIIEEIDSQYSMSFQLMMDTYVKIHEEEISELLGEIKNTNTELNDFAHIISHDLKAPLRSINSITEWLVTDYKDKLDEEGKKMLGMLSDKAVVMHDMINGVLQYSKVARHSEVQDLINIDDTIKEVIKLIDIPDTISLIVEDNLPTIHFEKTKIFQVFQNLLNNAIKFMDKPKGEIKVGCEKDRNFYKFHVSDNGPGIGEKYQEKIFQIFQTANGDDIKKISGIGLAIVKKIIENNGGKIWVESKINEGSIFNFTVPI